MLGLSEQRRIFLLGLTLNELVFILLFLLLLVIAIQFKETNKKLNEKRRDATVLENSVDTLKERVHILEATLDKLSIVSEGMDDSDLDQLFEDLVQVNELRAEVIEVHTQLTDTRQELNEMNKKQQLCTQIDAIQSENELLSNENTTLRGQVEYIKSRCKDKNGLDHPPCWVNAEGKIEYILKTVLHEGVIAVDAIWPTYRTESALSIPGVKQLAGSRHAPEKFKQLAKPILVWSKKQNPQCRHFVKVYDTPDTTKRAYINERDAVETYFYILKYNLRN